jgi:hypothetical protein
MGLLDIVSQLVAGGADATSLHEAAANVPTGLLGQGLAAAFRSDQTPAIGQMVGQLFGNSNAAQQAGMLNQLIATLGPAAAGVLAGGALGKVMSPGASQITAEQAEQLSADDVQRIVDHAHEARPGIADALGNFYAQHAGLIKTLGGVALTVALAHVKDRQAAA